MCRNSELNLKAWLLGPDAVAETFWKPMLKAFGKLQRRDDIMMAGQNKDGAVWVCTMGHLLGLFDKPWLNIPPTGILGNQMDL